MDPQTTTEPRQVMTADRFRQATVGWPGGNLTDSQCRFALAFIIGVLCASDDSAIDVPLVREMVLCGMRREAGIGKEQKPNEH